MKRPNVVVAIVLGLLAPGAGLMYAGWPKAALAVMLAFLLSIVGFPYLAVTGVVDASRLASLLAADALLFWGPSAAAGALAAVRAQPSSTRPPWTHPWWVIGVAVLTWFASSMLRSRVVVPYLVSFARADESMAPAFKEGALIIVKRRYAPNEVVPGALVLVGDKLRHVKSTESGIELDNGERVSPVDVLGVAVAAR